jgi:hypothetical protein
MIIVHKKKRVFFSQAVISKPGAASAMLLHYRDRCRRGVAVPDVAQCGTGLTLCPCPGLYTHASQDAFLDTFEGCA